MVDPDMVHGTEGSFPQSLWTLIANSQNESEAVAGKALDAFCRMYWLPVFGYIRGHGRPPEDAEDLTQSYFINLVGRDYIRRASRGKGKFRAFLLTDLKLFLANERRRDKTQKRGGGVSFIPLGEGWAEEKFASQAHDRVSPDHLFDRHWATTVLERVIESLRRKYETRNRLEVFETLKSFISLDEDRESYNEAAQRMGKDENYVKVNVHRLRSDFRKLLEEEVSHTVASPEEVPGEIRHLAAALGWRG